MSFLFTRFYLTPFYLIFWNGIMEINSYQEQIKDLSQRGQALRGYL